MAPVGPHVVPEGGHFVEYPLAVENTLRAIERARDYGLLGQNILGSGFNFDVEVHRGAGWARSWTESPGGIGCGPRA